MLFNWLPNFNHLPHSGFSFSHQDIFTMAFVSNPDKFLREVNPPETILQNKDSQLKWKFLCQAIDFDISLVTLQ